MEPKQIVNAAAPAGGVKNPALQSKLNVGVSEAQSTGLFKKQGSGFLQNSEVRGLASEISKTFSRQVKDASATTLPNQGGSDSVAASQMSGPSQGGLSNANAGGLVLTTCLKLAMVGDNRLSLGCDMLTDFLRGGFLPGKLYEVYGESGSGKTQLAIQLLLMSLLPVQEGGLAGKSLYLMTGKPLNEKRFVEMKESFLSSYKAKISEQDIHRQVIFSHCQTLEDYNKVFMNLAQRIETDRLRLLIIDNIQSVGDNFIRADGNVDFIERSNFLLKHAKALKRLAYQYKIVVVILNNVSSDVNQNGGDPTRGFFTEKRGAMQPALGLLWSNCVNERICLRKKAMGGGSAAYGDGMRRQISIEKSSYMRRHEIEFEVHPGGVRGKQ